MKHPFLLAFVSTTTAALVLFSSATHAFQPSRPRLLLYRRTHLSSNRNDLGRDLEGIQEAVAMKKTVEPGDTVVCKREIPESGFYENNAYELQGIFAQRFDETTQTIEKVPLENLDAPIPNGYDRYVTLYNPSFHSQPVVVTPEEVGLVSVRSEVLDSMWLAVPGFFWMFVCFTFYNMYHERTGGSFMDAFFGR